MALWLLGYPDAALADAKQALQEARDIGQATTLMFALFFTSVTQIFCGNYATATKQHDELIALADEKGSLYWKALCTPMQGYLFALTGKASDVASGLGDCSAISPAMRLASASNHVSLVVSIVNGFADAAASVIELAKLRIRSPKI